MTAAQTATWLDRAKADQQARRLQDLRHRCLAGIRAGWLTEAHGLAAIANYEDAAKAGRL